MDRRIYDIGDFRVDGSQRRLFDRGGRPVPLQARAFDVLMFMVQRPGEPLDKSSLMNAVWPDTVVEENNLTQCIFTLRKTLGDNAAEHRYIATIPGRGYQFVARVQAVSPRKVADDPASSGVQTGEVPVVAEGVRRSVRKGWLIAGITFALLVVSAILFWPGATPQTQAAQADAPAASPHTIAVLPFADLSPAKDMEYFADGIADELVTSLAKVANLRVIGRRSAFAFKGRNEDAQSIGRMLGVANILEGSVRADGDRIRISAQLTRTHDGVGLWTRSYDRKLDDVLDIQGSIAREVVDELAPMMGKARDAKTGNGFDASLTQSAEAYRAYLRGVNLHKRWTDSARLQARDEFLRAVELDPQFAQAHAWLARTYRRSARRAIGDIAQNKALASASLDTALELDPAIADLWWVKMEFIERDNAPLAVRASGLERALDANPGDAEAMLVLGQVYIQQARRADALRIYETAYAADPLWLPAIASTLAATYQFKNDRPRTLALLDEMDSLAPGDPGPKNFRSAMAFVEGRALDWDLWKTKAIEAAPRAQPIHGYLALDYAQLGLFDAALHHAQVCTVLNPQTAAGLFNVVHIKLAAGDVPAAKQAVQEAITHKPADYLAQLAQGQFQYFTGDCAGSVQSMALARPAYDQPAGSLDLITDPEHVATFVWCLRRQGDTTRVAELSKAFDIQYAPPTTPGVFEGWRARMAAATGDRDALVRHLTDLANTKSMVYAFLLNEPMIQPYLQDPQIKPLLATLEARRAEWRRILPKNTTRVPIPSAGTTAAR
jgi:TolB-like protein/DNA-binding winged helix-turn-helix (wHTH) protein